MTVHTLLSPFVVFADTVLLSLCFFLGMVELPSFLWALGLSAIPRSLPFSCRPSVRLLLPGGLWA